MKNDNNTPAAGQAAHTPTPYAITTRLAVQIEGHNPTELISIEAEGYFCGGGIALVRKDANAEFIVTACNAYAANQSTISALNAKLAQWEAVSEMGPAWVAASLAEIAHERKRSEERIAKLERALQQLLWQADACKAFRDTFTPSTRDAAWAVLKA